MVSGIKYNKLKTVTILFHLKNHEAYKTLNIKINKSKVPYDKTPKYLGYNWIEL